MASPVRPSSLSPITAALRHLSSAASLPPHLVLTGSTPTSSPSPHHSSNPIQFHLPSQSPIDYASHFSPTLPSSNPNPNPNSLLASLSSTPSIPPARRLFDEMLLRKTPFTTLGFGLFIAKLCKTDQPIDGILQIVQQINHKRRRKEEINGSIVAFLIVHALCKSGRKEDAQKVLEELRELDCKPDFIAYRTVSEAFRRAERYEEEKRILREKRKFGVAPRERDYREFVYLLVREKRILEAKEVTEAIINGDFIIDYSLVNCLIGYVSDFDTDTGMMFCEYMVKKGRLPSIKNLSNLCRNLCKDEKGDELIKILEIVLRNGLSIGSEYYQLAVSFLCKAGKVREAYDLINDMRKKQMEPKIFHYNSLMRALCKNDLTRPAKKLWDEMFTKGCEPNLQTYNILIKKFSEIGNVQEAKFLYEKMLAKGVQPDNYTHEFIIGVFCKENENNVDEAVWVVNKAIELDVKIGSVALKYLVLSLCKQGKFKQVHTILSGVKSNIDTLNSRIIFLKSLTAEGEIDMAMQHIHWIGSNTNIVLQIVLDELISSLSTAPKLENVIKLIRALTDKGLLSSDSPYTSLLQDYST